MILDEPPVRPNAPRMVAAAWAIWTLGVMGVLHAAIVFLAAQPEKITGTGPGALAAMTALNAAIGVGVVWLGHRLRQGHSAAVACAAIALDGFVGAVTIAMTLDTKTGHQGMTPLLAAQCVLALTWVVALTLGLRAWAAR
jgi:hypothetical protein